MTNVERHDHDRFANAQRWARKYGLNAVSVRQALREGRLPGFRLGGRWLVDTDRANELYDFDRRDPAA
jgi:hypothetical protein